MLKYKNEINKDISKKVKEELSPLDMKVLGGIGANINYNYKGKGNWKDEFLGICKKYINLKINKKFIIPVGKDHVELARYSVDIMHRIKTGDLSEFDSREPFTSEQIEESLSFRRIVKHVHTSMKSSVTLVTHNTRFHADEVVACALLGQIYENVHIQRIPHCNSLEDLKNIKGLDYKDMDFLLDTGRYLDGFQYFDHHQYKGGLSTAGLVLKYLQEVEPFMFNFEAIEEVVKKVDQVDVGENTGQLGDLSNVISTMYIDETDADDIFMLALNFAGRYIQGLLAKNHSKEIMVETINKADFIEGTTVKYIDHDLTGWNRVVFLKDLDDYVEAVVTKKNEETYIIKTVGRELGSYEKAGRSMVPHKSIPFTHAAGFISKATDYESMYEYVRNIYPKDKIGFYLLEDNGAEDGYSVYSSDSGEVNQFSLTLAQAIKFAEDICKAGIHTGEITVSSKRTLPEDKKFKVIYVNEEFSSWPDKPQDFTNVWGTVMRRKEVEKNIGTEIPPGDNQLIISGREGTPIKDLLLTIPRKVPFKGELMEGFEITISRTGEVSITGEIKGSEELREALNSVSECVSEWIDKNKVSIEGLVEEE